MGKRDIDIFHHNPSQVLQLGTRNAADWHYILDKKREKWKNWCKTPNLFHCFCFFLVLLLPVCVLGEGERWDGVVVTESNFLALQAFKQELIDPKGFLRSWNDTGYGACSGGWVGIKCAQGQVIVIQLPWKGLKGHITERIGQLEGLRKLSLHDNQIGGSIPSALGLLPNLRGVQLFNNRLQGSIPISLGSCPLLQSLDLSNNLLTGKIPDSLANSTKLFSLNLSFNSLSGSIPNTLTRLPSLTFFSIQHNNLSGSIPNAIGSLSRLQSLDFSNNALNGSLPASLSNLSSLTLLNVENNHLGDQIPESLGRLRNLSVLSLSRNQFNGNIPASIGNVSSLTQLDMSRNHLSGEIPTSFNNLRNLKFFNVSYNNLSGPVPILLAQKFNASSFVGNIQLCGYSTSTPCPSEAPSEVISAPSPEVVAKHHHHGKLSIKDIILIAAGALLFLLVILICILLYFLIRKRAELQADGGRATGKAGTAGAEAGVAAAAGGGGGAAEAGGEAGGKLVHFDGPTAFTADDLLCATAEIMGKSTYGTVYKATLEDGSEVAVKRLREKITKSQREFESEVGILGKIRHPNLLALRAYYLGPKGEKLLVFDYMPKGSLATFLHGK